MSKSLHNFHRVTWRMSTATNPSATFMLTAGYYRSPPNLHRGSALKAARTAWSACTPAARIGFCPDPRTPFCTDETLEGKGCYAPAPNAFTAMDDDLNTLDVHWLPCSIWPGEINTLSAVSPRMPLQIAAARCSTRLLAYWGLLYNRKKTRCPPSVTELSGRPHRGDRQAVGCPAEAAEGRARQGRRAGHGDGGRQRPDRLRPRLH